MARSSTCSAAPPTCPPRCESAEAAIDTFEATTACLGVRLEPGGRWRIYAPRGLADVFNLVVRPNPVLAPPHVYQAKTSRWRRQWPDLTVLPWPDTRPGTRPPGGPVGYRRQKEDHA